ncbi:hypothetical protein CH063_11709, partial [Colletotrichum higginsianum]
LVFLSRRRGPFQRGSTLELNHPHPGRSRRNLDKACSSSPLVILLRLEPHP